MTITLSPVSALASVLSILLAAGHREVSPEPLD
jgi:hypothetical protein